jgi:hypothetical protein
MILTEAEAKTKWCPFSRIGAYGQNRNQDPPVDFREPCTCIASRCMAWRKTTTDVLTESQGYCGLAGKPIDNFF